MLMHCVMVYPVPGKSANLRNISTLVEEFELSVGYSDRALGIDVCVSVGSAGAMAIENILLIGKQVKTSKTTSYQQTLRI